MRSLIECVPNFSEGRDPAKIDALAEAIGGVAGAWVLDCHRDADHNRCVITLAGEPESVAEAALRGVGKAAELIDLTHHVGAHPRIGAADVVPFVPLEGATLAQCAALAHRVGDEIWARYGVPVYFYGAAASCADRAPLENVRRGAFEGLRDAALLSPERAPDIGGPALHPAAGATAVGARNFLIACNVNLQAPDVAVAKKIARTIRAANGGLPGVKAIALWLESRGLAQVSMNLTDFAQTPLQVVLQRVYEEAARNGCTVAGTEIVGLVPRAALAGFSRVELPDFLTGKILEDRLAAVVAASGSNERTPDGILLKSAAR